MWSSPKAVPQVAMAVVTPARWQAMTSVYPSTTTARPVRPMSFLARSMPYRTWDFLYSGVSGVLRYLGPLSSSRSLRAPKPTTSPVMSRMGHISRPRKRSMGPRRPSLASPDTSSSLSVKPLPRR